MPSDPTLDAPLDSAAPPSPSAPAAPAAPATKPKQAAYAADEALSPGEHRAPGSRAKDSLEASQRRLRTKLQRRAGVVSLTPQSLGAWLEDQIAAQSAESAEEALKAPRLLAKDVVRMFLTEKPLDGANAGEVRLHTLLKKIFHTACNEKSPFQIAAAKVLMEQGFGRPGAAEDPAASAGRKGGLTVVYVDRAQLDPDIPLVTTDAQHAPRALQAPQFIDAELVEDGR